MNLEKPSRTLHKLAASLKHKKYRQLEKLSTAEGYKLLEEALNAGIPLHSAFFTQKAAEDHPDLLDNYKKSGIKTYSVSPGEMERISALKAPPGNLLIYRTDYELKPVKEGTILCINKISDPGNLGTILRAAEWFGVSKVLLAPESAELHNPATVRGSMGAVFRMAIAEEVDLFTEIDGYKRAGYKVISAETRGGETPAGITAKVVLLIGDEQGNLPENLRQLADLSYSIPRSENSRCESLNIALAGGIILYELSKS